MHLIPDLAPSLALTAPFLVAFFGLWFILWKPLMEFLDEREKATDGTRIEAKELSEQADQRAAKLEARLAKAHQEVVDLKAEARGRAKAKEADILSAARKQADVKIGEAQKQIETERLAAKAELEATTQSLSKDIVSALLT